MPDERYQERRKRTLTDEDIEAIREELQCSRCSFTHDEAETLKGLAKNMNRASSLATKTIVTGMVLGFLSMVWLAIKHMVFEFVKNGAIPK